MSGIRKMFDAAPPDVVNLGLGEPDFDPPEEVREALFQAVRQGLNKYGPSAGIAPLREAIARKYARHDPTTTLENVLVTVGGSEGLAVVALSMYNPGDEVLVPNPGFVLYGPHARLAGARPVPYPLTKENSFLPDLDGLEKLITPRTKAIVVNSPSNPTGAVIPRKMADQICALANAHDLAVISDEAYDEIVYTTEPFTSFWGRADKVVVVNSFSKTFAMTGWRLGYLLAPRAFVAEANKIHYHLVACPATPPQIAALKGLEVSAPATQAMTREFRARRDIIVKGLRAIPGMSIVSPKGAFYAFPAIDWRDRSDVEVAQGLLRKGLLLTPGTSFGSLGEGHLRLSFATSRDKIQRALDILRAYADDRS